jgi:hypothetical protein
MADWARRELNGYDSNADCPKYRHLSGTIMVQNRWGDWQEPLGDVDEFSTRPVLQGISTLEDPVLNSRNGRMRAGLNQGIQDHLLGRASSDAVAFAIDFTTAQFQGIFAQVRHKILDWALRNDSTDGKTDQGVTAEIEPVGGVVNVFNNYGGSPIVQQGSPGSTQQIHGSVDDVLDLLKQIRALAGELDPDAASETIASLDCIEAQVQSKSPNRNILKESVVAHLLRTNVTA